MDTHKVERFWYLYQNCEDEYVCKIGEYLIWIGSYPYSFGHLYKPSSIYYKLPSVKTRKRLKKAYDESITITNHTPETLANNTGILNED